MSSQTPRRALRRHELEAKVGLGRSAIYERMARNDFPKPFRLGNGRAVAWDEAEVDAWLNDQISRRDSKAHRP